MPWKDRGPHALFVQSESTITPPPRALHNRRAMDIVEFLLFIPLLIYGIALSQLLGQWKRIFDFKSERDPKGIRKGSVPENEG